MNSESAKRVDRWGDGNPILCPQGGAKLKKSGGIIGGITKIVIARKS
jgi:hypothetical protein